MEYSLDISNSSQWLALGILFFPLLTSLTLLAINRKSVSGYISSLSGFLILIFSLVLGYAEWNQQSYLSFEWFVVGDFVFQVGFILDNMTLMMLVVVALVALLVSIFSIEYMKDDPGKSRYFMFLGMFAFSMYGIVLSSNLLMTFFFWELVGFSSYLLIGFWYEQSEPPKASFKAFIVNRVGDAGFLIGLFVVFGLFGTFEFPLLWEKSGQILSLEDGSEYSSLLILMGIGLFLGAVGKSAQFPLQTWLPDAMAGPTPVSALIHAATMVAAGVFMLIRVFPLMTQTVLVTMAVIGALTAFMGAFAAFAQEDIKKVLAYSTISQLGYMVMAIGVGATDFAFFHLVTHAFFKAGLFLCAGSVIHYMHHQHVHGQDGQNMQSMGGLKKHLPITFVAYTICMLALSGIPFFSGFFSKEGILSATTIWNPNGAQPWLIALPVVLAFATVFMTAYYMGKQYFLVFFGQERFNLVEQKSVNESIFFKAPLIVLAFMSVWFVYSINPLAHGGFLVIENLQHAERMISTEIQHGKMLLTFISIGLALLGLATAYIFVLRNKFTGVTQVLNTYLTPISKQNWFLDDIQMILVVKPVRQIQRLLNGLDSRLVDGLVNFSGITVVVGSRILGWWDKNVVDGLVNGIANVLGYAGHAFRKVQGGKIQTYFIWAVLSLIITFLLLI